MTTETKEKYCPICGKPVTESTYTRFGEWCCSEAHAEEYVKEVRDQKAQATAARQDRPVSPSGYEEGPWDEEERERGGCGSGRWFGRPRWFGRRRGGCG